MYLFGHFDLDGANFDPYSGLNEALLGIREASQPTRRGACGAHIVHHPAALMPEAHSFMFGLDPEQPQAMPWEELCFALASPETAG